MPLGYEAIFQGQTSSTQSLADKAIWVASLSLDETEIEEPDKIAKFTAACVRLASAANEIDLVITDSLNRHNYEALQKDSTTAQVLATESGAQWRLKKQKDLAVVKNLKNTFSWDAIFEGLDKQALIKLLESHYDTVAQFRLSVDNAASHRVSFITEMALKKTPSMPVAPGDVMTQKFKAYVIEECAGVLIMRLKGYKHAFYLAKLNLATSTIATTIFPTETAEANNSEMLNAINKTILTFHTPSQYKPTNNALQQVATTQMQRTKDQSSSSSMQYSPSMVEEQLSPHVDTRTALGVFFDSGSIPVNVKLDVLFKLISHNKNNTTFEVSTTTALDRTDTVVPIISGTGFSMTSGAATMQDKNNNEHNNTNGDHNNNNAEHRNSNGSTTTESKPV